MRTWELEAIDRKVQGELEQQLQKHQHQIWFVVLTFKVLRQC